MYSLINSIIKLINKYTSFSTLYVEEFENDMSIFEFFNGLILFTILVFIFIRFLIKKYTFKTVLIFILKRLFIASFLFFFIYLLSDFTLCETPINKGIKKGIKGLIDTENKKYVCIAIATVTGCYLAYKYVPGWYDNIKLHNKYINYLDKKNKYDSKLKLYLEYIEKKTIVKQNFIDNFNLMCKNFTDSILLFFKSYNKYKGNMDYFENNRYIFVTNRLFSKYILGTPNESFNVKIFQIVSNYNDSLKILNDLKTSDKKYNFDFDLLETNHLIFLEEFTKLKLFYQNQVADSIIDITNQSDSIKNSVVLESIFRTNQLKVFNDLEILLDNNINCSLFLLTFVENIVESPELTNNMDNIYNFSTILKPKKIKIIDYPLENLEGVKFISINLGYIFFYPVLYCSNKIFGTNNPLSAIAFKKAIDFFIGYGGFF